MIQNDWVKHAFGVITGGFCFFTLILPPVALFGKTELGMAVALLLFPLLFFFGSFLPCLFFCGKKVLSELELKLPEQKDILYAFLAIPLFCLFAGITAVFKICGVQISPQPLASFAGSCSDGMFFLILITAGILAPVAEELAYRKVIFQFFQTIFSSEFLLPCFFASFLFAVSHGINWHSLLLFFFSVSLQLIRSGRSLVCAMLTHIVFNWCSLIMLCIVRAGILS